VLKLQLKKFRFKFAEKKELIEMQDHTMLNFTKTMLYTVIKRL